MKHFLKFLSVLCCLLVSKKRTISNVSILPENGGTLDFGHVGKGLYLFKLTLPNGKSESQKMKF